MSQFLHPYNIICRYPFPSGIYVFEMEETDIFRCFQRNFFLRLIATGEAGILLSSYLLWTTATQNHGRICKFVPLLTAMYLKEEKIPISSCFSEKIFKIFRSTLLPKESIPFCKLCSQKRWFSEFRTSFCKKSKKIPSTRKSQVRGCAVFAINFYTRNSDFLP